jgi:hypothetical protein
MPAVHGRGQSRGGFKVRDAKSDQRNAHTASAASAVGFSQRAKPHRVAGVV